LGNNGKDENLSPYAWSKSKNIELIKNYNKWFGLKYEFVYFYNVYGPGQIMNSSMSAVIGIFEEQYKKNKPLTIVKPGTQRRDFTHIDDIVHGCYLAWKKGNQNEYMLGTKKNYAQLLKLQKCLIQKLNIYHLDLVKDLGQL
jgi:UDP-glucose 4-epimerase